MDNASTKPISNGVAPPPMQPTVARPTNAVAGTKRKATDGDTATRVTEDGVTAEKSKDTQVKRRKTVNHDAESESEDTIFTPQPALAIAPWTHDFAAPTPTYATRIACPIDWTKIQGPKCRPDAIRAYELRAPWNDPPVPFKDVANAITISEEGARKRFKKANLAVFEATGVYFKTTTLGLGAHGIPDSSELQGILDGAVGKEKKTQKVGARSTKSEVARRSLSYDGVPFTLVIRPPGQTGGISRLVTEEVTHQLHISSHQIIRCSAVTFDRWYSCLSMGLRHTFPKRVYRLEPFLDSYTHTDFGTPPTTVNDYFETYTLSQLMGTTDVSDMILDELIQVLREEENLLAKYRSGELTMHETEDVVRFMNFEPEDINTLWKTTKPDDPIRELVLDILWHKGSTAEEKISEEATEFDTDFLAAWNTRKAEAGDVIGDFIRGKSLGNLCAVYHNHSGAEDCFRAKPEPPSVVPDEVSLLSAKTPLPRRIKLCINGIDGFVIQDRTDARYRFGEATLASVYRRNPDWQWERVRSINTYAYGAQGGDKVSELRPIYFDQRTADTQGRYPSHPGYANPHWTPPNTEDQEVDEEEDGYDVPWIAAKKDGIPQGARRIREDKGTGDIFFDIEDEHWYPPADWESDMEKRPDQSREEFQEYRKWLWVRMGGAIPCITVKRFRPHERNFAGWRDPLEDARPKR